VESLSPTTPPPADGPEDPALGDPVRWSHARRAASTQSGTGTVRIRPPFPETCLNSRLGPQRFGML
jgi:hypothetical protein